jgi:hypothetical protein
MRSGRAGPHSLPDTLSEKACWVFKRVLDFGIKRIKAPGNLIRQGADRALAAVALDF